MILIPGIAKKKIGVYGLGATGLATCEALSASGAEVYAWDDKEEARAKTVNTRYAAEHPKAWPWEDMRSLALSPGVPLTHPTPHPVVKKAHQAGVEVIGDIEFFARAVNALPPRERPRIIAVTGSNGKSTTTALIGHLLKECGRESIIGGNIGKPVLLLPPLEAFRTYVLELSSFQLDLAKTLRANTAILLNLSPDHIDRHGDMEGYAAAKRRIFLNQTADDTAIIGVDDPWSQGICAKLMSAAAQRVTPISAEGALGSGVFALNARLYYSLGERTGEAGDISGVPSLRGQHNWQNASAALAAAIAEGVAPNIAAKAMDRYPGLPHRMEIVAKKDAVTFVNDSKATNADAASRALKSYADIFWIAGGKAKEGGVVSLRPLMDKVRGVYLIGEAARDFEGQLAGAAPCFQCGDLPTAVARAARDAALSGLEAPVVLLSPACASYDQFRNFEERGEVFRKLANQTETIDGEAA
ncbi:MAG: UDP-N-acetylmuramoyl-L-alanine--D-glutamate ligase [Alphaproteobacteria bacterium RIFCSPHIGHO2_12_FULL_63_12]|nr:MAG: UDP-N-acetylmuramoyl-L-alanine--D-glutamate ligase [Alphaproteobacteria bacterium RIFCSPHIGHO2_12_FULL_63_12]